MIYCLCRYHVFEVAQIRLAHQSRDATYPRHRDLGVCVHHPSYLALGRARSSRSIRFGYLVDYEDLRLSTLPEKNSYRGLEQI
jgi:hypothetical protein